MRVTRIVCPFAAIFLCLIGFEIPAQAQNAINPQRLEDIRNRLSGVKKLLESLPSPQQHNLSSGAQNMLQLARRWDDVEGALQSLMLADIQAVTTRLLPSLPAPNASIRGVSNP